MVVDRVLCIEDSNEKFMDMFRFLRNQNISHIDWAINAEKALELVENSTKAGTNYDLIISDMRINWICDVLLVCLNLRHKAINSIG